MKSFNRFITAALLVFVAFAANAVSMSDYLENKLVDHVFRATAYTAPVTQYVGLSTGGRLGIGHGGNGRQLRARSDHRRNHGMEGHARHGYGGIQRHLWHDQQRGCGHIPGTNCSLGSGDAFLYRGCLNGRQSNGVPSIDHQQDH